MKKFAALLIACIAIFQSGYAATSALTESLLEYEAITNAIGTDPTFEGVIPATEFITDIKRITKEVDITGEVKYKIITEDVATTPTTGHCGCHKKNHHHTYIAVLSVTPNPGIGPNIVTVVSITKV